MGNVALTKAMFMQHAMGHADGEDDQQHADSSANDADARAHRAVRDVCDDEIVHWSEVRSQKSVVSSQ